MSDHDPPKFPDLSGPAADTPTVPQSVGSIFTRPVAAEQPVMADAPIVQPTTANAGWRWAVAGVATVLVVGLLGAALVLARPGGGTPSTVARYAPAGTVAYMELRQDLPGDQHGLLAQFMSHFPGFADQSTFDQKIDEILDSLVGRGQSGISWQQNIKPWFGGQIGVFTTTLAPASGTPPSSTAVLSVKGGQKPALDAWLTPLLGSGFQQTTYQSQIIWTGALAGSTDRVSFATTDEALLFSTRVEDLQAALDARSDRTPGLADDQFFLQQLGALHGDRLGTFYVDSRAMAASLGSQLGTGLPSPVIASWLVDAAAVRVVGEIRAESDHLAITTRTERPANADLPPLPTNRSSTLASLVPAQSLVYVEMHDVGQAISFVLNRALAPQPGASPAIDLNNIGQILGTSIPDYFDFITDVGVSYSNIDGDQLFGLVASVDDSAIAKSRVDKLLALARTLIQFGGGVTFEAKDFNGVPGTVITFNTGTASAVGAIAVVLNGNNLIIGNEEFVAFALDHPATASLGQRAEFQQGLNAGGVNNAGVAFIDVAALRGLVEQTMTADARSTYEANQKPFLEPLSHLMMVNTTDGTTIVSHVFLYVK